MSISYTAGEGQGLRFDSEILGQRQPWTVSHSGLEYPGEVIVAETVSAEWGQPLSRDICFRIVLYTVPRRIPAGQIRDPRIAMVVPRRPADPTRESLSREIQAIHEAKERYVTERDPDAQAIRSSMEEREASLLGELARREAISYSQGRIYTGAGMSQSPSEPFVEGNVQSWVDHLVKAVLLQAHSELPFEYSEFPSTLTIEKIAAIYRGLFQGDPDDAGIAADFGPALGVTTRDSPSVFDAGGCRVVDIIQGELGRRGGEMPAQDLLGMLSYEHGLTRALATFYLLACVRQAHSEVELVSGHSVQLRQGQPLLSGRISSDLVPEILFDPAIADHLGMLRAQPSLVWNSVLPYASLLVEGLELTQDASDIAEQEARLVGALEQMGQRIEGSRVAVQALGTGIGERAETTLSALDRLEVLCATTGYRNFYTVAADSFGGPSGMREALDIYDRLERLVTLAPAITQTRLYLDEMTFGRDHQDMAVRRDALLGRVGLDSLIGNPSLWNSVEEGSQQLRREYAATYLSHHLSYHQEALESISELDRLRPQVEALGRFNELSEFGGPFGAETPARFKELMASIRTCMASEEKLSLEAAPTCDACQLPLNEDFPRRETALVLSDVEKAMREYNRLLSSEGVRRILAHPTSEQLDQFINLVQISDLSSLANVLDEDVVEFLRQFVDKG